MNTEEQNEYRAHVRGAATYILLGQKDPPMSPSKLVQIYKLDLAAVNADIDAIVQGERVKVGGVFEAKQKIESLPDLTNNGNGRQ